jgi:hypothetical protein
MIDVSRRFLIPFISLKYDSLKQFFSENIKTAATTIKKKELMKSLSWCVLK